MKAILLILLFTMIVSLGHQPNLRSFRNIPRRAPSQSTEVKTNDADEFYSNPPEEYAAAKKYFDEYNRFEQLMGILQNRNNPIQEAYKLCNGYSPEKTCKSFINEIAKQL